MAKLDFRSKRTWAASAAILAIAGGLTAAFAWTKGWGSTRLTSSDFVQKTTPSFPPGYRRAHGKGMCFIGTFRGTQDAAAASVARVFSQREVPVVGRFSIGAGHPHAADNATKTVSMSLLLTSDDQQQWRLAMNNQPYFPTHAPAGLLALLAATASDPATGKPDPNRVAAFLKTYPEAGKFLEWAAQAPSPSSFDGVEFNGVNAFYLVASDGHRQPVRWTMQSHDPFTPLDEAQARQSGHDFLFDDLTRKLARKPLYWDMVMQLAQPGDPVDDPSQPWPQSRKQFVAGTLEITQVIAQAEGPCRDVNFDPTIVPAGIEVSDDPILSARSGAYSHSFNRRLREIAHGEASDAVGKGEAK